MNPFLRLSLVLSAGICLTPATSQAQTVDSTVAIASTAVGCERTEAPSPLQRRIAEYAMRGKAPLIQFVHRTRMIYQLDLLETVDWLDQQRAAARPCGIAATSANPTADES